ncbi:MATE family efflux transporter [Acinetobacter larvae]|uniref:MATE family efflux transporter n=1 Tax=Acinetobacter larvae TaxID=1789224 RepID=A0A1B2M3D0_9GAMM|nr:MATE family efflux transporter [Acinetobacter larvae]AOA59706.1 MATE family efflux transporter [Acinetobacter larvae]
MPPRDQTIQQTHFYKTFLIFVLPLIATNILQNMSGTLNAVFVGQMLGVDAVAAISVFFPILFCIIAFVIGLSAGATILVGQAWGAKQIEKVSAVVGACLFLTLIGGLFIAIFGVIFSENLLRLLGVSEQVMHLSLPYVRCMLAASPILFVYMIFTAVLRGVGDSTTPLFALSLTCLIGVVVTPTLIRGYGIFPALGIIAPAIASIIGYVAVLVFLGFYLKYKKHALQMNRALLKQIRYQPEWSALILKLGIPTGVQMVTNSIAGLVIIGLVNRYGVHATAAYGAVNQVLNYIQFPAISIAIAASIFAAQAIGAGKQDLLRKVTRTALSVNLLMTGGLIILAYIGAEALMALFITDPAVVDVGRQLLFIVLWSYLFFGVAAIFASIMRASGTVNMPMLINLVAIALIEVPCAYWFSSIWGLKGIWYAYALAFVCLSMMQGIYYQWVWKKKSIQALI